MSLSVQSKTRRRLAFLFSVPLAFSLVFFFVNQASEHRETRLLEVQRLSTCVRQLRTLARDAESGERGYLLTGDEHYATPLAQANDTAESTIRNCLAQARGRPQLLPSVEQVVALVRQRLALANRAVEVARKLGYSNGLLQANPAPAEEVTNRMRRIASQTLRTLDRDEVAILESQRAYSRWSFAFFSAGSLLMIAVIVWLYNVLLRYLSERDSANAQLQSANVHLEARIEERTRDLTHANEELQQFAYVASHDLQEPLRTITSFSQLLAIRYQGKLDGDADEFIGYIVTASRRMTDLINGLLAMVRLRKAGQPTQPVSFEDLLRQAEISLQASIRENEAVVTRGPLPALMVDSVQLSQVLQNLLSNAIKYRSEAPPRIHLEAHREAGQWTFSVRDNGRGFQQEFADRIFGLFQRLHGREVEGTGMGLSISKKIIERHGGRMWATSVENAGSTFYFTLPSTLEVFSTVPETSDSAVSSRAL